jgi:hypothetical protein
MNFICIQRSTITIVFLFNSGKRLARVIQLEAYKCKIFWVQNKITFVVFFWLLQNVDFQVVISEIASTAILGIFYLLMTYYMFIYYFYFGKVGNKVMFNQLPLYILIEL